MKKWDLENPEKVRASKRKYELTHKDELAEKRAVSAVRKAYQKEYGRVNRKEISHKQAARKKNDPNFKIRINLRNRLGRAIKGDYKTGSSIKDLGCSVEEFKIYLESKFQSGMNWKNWGKGPGYWQMDHIRPLHLFDLTGRKEFLEACHFTNLQPLWYEEHINKTKLDKKRAS